MPTYIVELPPSAPAINGIRSIIVDAHDADTARQMAAYYSNSNVASWEDNATVRLVAAREDLLGWKIAIQVIRPVNDPEGPDPGPTVLVDYVYSAVEETLGMALANITTELDTLTYTIQNPDGPDEVFPVPITPSLSGDSDIGWTLTVADPADVLGDWLLRVGVFPPGTPVIMNGGAGDYGITGFITSLEYGGSGNSALNINWVGDGWTIPGIPDAGADGGDPGSTGGAGDPGSTPPDPGTGAGGGAGSSGSGGSGDLPGGSTQGPDGDPPHASVGADPRDMPASAPSVRAWFRTDQLVAKIFGRANIHALGNLVNVSSSLRDRSAGSSNRVLPGYMKVNSAFNGRPSISTTPPNGFLVSNADSSGIGVLSTSLDYHGFLIVREVAATLNARWVSGRTDNANDIIKNGADTVAMRNTAGTGVVNATTIPALGEAFLLEWRYSGLAGDFMRVNGGAKSGATAAGSTPVDTFVIGGTATAGARASIEIAEFIIFNGELTDTDGALSSLYAYLADRYNLTIAAPS